MWRQRVHTFFPYVLAFLFIGSWWIFAFTPTRLSVPIATPLTPKSVPPLFASLSSLERETLQRALAGEWALMTTLIADWDIDAQLLEITCPTGVQRLSRHTYLRSQVIGRQLKQQRTSNMPRILPQTYVAASFLLALTQPNQIVALPRGLRTQTALFSKQLTDQIPLDIDRYDSETLFLAQPQVAFVAPYSHPATLDTLSHQGVQLVTLQESHSIADICDNLMQVGRVIQRPLEAELMALFIEAAMQAIDNHLLALRTGIARTGIAAIEIEHPFSRALFVTYNTHYSVPAVATLTRQLLQRLNVETPFAEHRNSWTQPIYQEQLIQCHPDCLIVASPYDAKTLLHRHPALATLPAIQQGKFFVVDDAIQQFPSQYIVLAYYDLYQALVTADLL